MPDFILSQPDSPFWYWSVFFVFGPFFTFGYWGLLGMGLVHLLVFGVLLLIRRQAIRRQAWPRRLLGGLGLLMVTNALVFVIIYGGIWLFSLF